MNCDCRPDSACTSTSACGENSELENVVEDLWINSKSVLTGAFTVVGFLLYRFSQALPFIIRWPIRIFCSLTGLSSLWSWVSRVASTIRGIPCPKCVVIGLKTVGKWLSSLWKFTAALPNKLGWVSNVAKAIAGSLTNIKKCADTLINLIQRLRGLTKKDKPQKAEQYKQTSIQSSPAPPSPSGPCDSGLRIILVGPPGAGRTLLGDTLLGCRGSFSRASRECVRQRAFVEGREVTVVDTPDLLGSSLGAAERAREALRSIQLASPGPHAFLLVMPAPGSGGGAGDTDESAALETLMVLMGEGALGHVLPVLTHADSLSGTPTLAQLLQGAHAGLKHTLSVCVQRAELARNGPACPMAERRGLCARLLERVEEMRELGGCYIHELQKREQRIREKLLEDMAAPLEIRLGVRGKED